MFSALKEKQAVEFPWVIKGDVQGSVEAIVSAVNKISNEDIRARVLHAARRHHRERRHPRQGLGSADHRASTSVPTPRRARLPSATVSPCNIMT
jgi:hypothetical protein